MLRAILVCREGARHAHADGVTDRPIAGAEARRGEAAGTGHQKAERGGRVGRYEDGTAGQHFSSRRSRLFGVRLRNVSDRPVCRGNNAHNSTRSKERQPIETESESIGKRNEEKKKTCGKTKPRKIDLSIDRKQSTVSNPINSPS